MRGSLERVAERETTVLSDEFYIQRGESATRGVISQGGDSSPLTRIEGASCVQRLRADAQMILCTRMSQFSALREGYVKHKFTL